MNKDELFKKALSFVLKWEGGFVNDPDDKGGATNKGVTQKIYDSYREGLKLDKRSVKEITEIEVQEIYKKMYWETAGCNNMHPVFAVLVFDTAINMGVKVATKFLKVAEYKHPDKYILARVEKYVKYARVGRQSKYLLGWLNRVFDLVEFINKEVKG